MHLDEATLHRVEAALLDVDGSCRDINFAEYISASAARDVLGVIASSWTLNRATTSEGDDIAKEELHGRLGQPSGALTSVWSGGSNPAHIQAYFYWEEVDSVFCEVTFFPADFDSQTFKLMDFLSFVSKLAMAARSTEYYVRYEDGSWRHGQHGADCVILSDKVLSFSRN